jgi:hypothetical protein
LLISGTASPSSCHRSSLVIPLLSDVLTMDDRFELFPFAVRRLKGG